MSQSYLERKTVLKANRPWYTEEWFLRLPSYTQAICIRHEWGESVEELAKEFLVLEIDIEDILEAYG